MAKERVPLSSRWRAPSPAPPQAPPCVQRLGSTCACGRGFCKAAIRLVRKLQALRNLGIPVGRFWAQLVAGRESSAPTRQACRTAQESDAWPHAARATNLTRAHSHRRLQDKTEHEGRARSASRSSDGHKQAAALPKKEPAQLKPFAYPEVGADRLVAAQSQVVSGQGTVSAFRLASHFLSVLVATIANPKNRFGKMMTEPGNSEAKAGRDASQFLAWRIIQDCAADWGHKIHWRSGGCRPHVSRQGLPRHRLEGMATHAGDGRRLLRQAYLGWLPETRGRALRCRPAQKP